MSDLTDEVLNLKLVEFLEPRPTDWISGAYPRDTQWWCWRVLDDPARPRGYSGRSEWYPRFNFVTDPAMRDMLQAKLLGAGWSLRFQKLQDGYELECGFGTSATSFYGHEREKRTAIAGSVLQSGEPDMSEKHMVEELMRLACEFVRACDLGEPIEPEIAARQALESALRKLIHELADAYAIVEPLRQERDSLKAENAELRKACGLEGEVKG